MRFRSHKEAPPRSLLLAVRRSPKDAMLKGTRVEAAFEPNLSMSTAPNIRITEPWRRVKLGDSEAVHFEVAKRKDGSLTCSDT